MPDSAYLTINDVAERLAISPDGVRKLIRRGRLRAVKRSAHKTLIPSPAFDAYMRDLNGRDTGADWESAATPPPTATLETRCDQFEREHGQSPQDWLAEWTRTDEDSAESMRTAVDATALVAEARGASRGSRHASASTAA